MGFLLPAVRHSEFPPTSHTLRLFLIHIPQLPNVLDRLIPDSGRSVPYTTAFAWLKPFSNYSTRDPFQHQRLPPRRIRFFAIWSFKNRHTVLAFKPHFGLCFAASTFPSQHFFLLLFFFSVCGYALSCVECDESSLVFRPNSSPPLHLPSSLLIRVSLFLPTRWTFFFYPTT